MDVSTRTIEIWMRQNRIPFEKIGRTVRFHWGDVRAYLSRRNYPTAQLEIQMSPIEGSRAHLRKLAATIRKRRQLIKNKATRLVGPS